MYLRYIFTAIIVALLPTASMASLTLDKVIIDIADQETGRADIELANEGAERMYVAVEPFEILKPDQSDETRVELPIGDDSPLFVSPRRLILEAGERRLVRIAAIGGRPESERTFRVRIRPVAGEVVGEDSGLKLMIGYDTLVLLRPSNRKGSLTVVRESEKILVRNDSNTSYEFFDGKACQTEQESCRSIKPNRLYPGETWEISAMRQEKIEFSRIVNGKTERVTF